MDVWGVPTFYLLQTALPWTLVYKYPFESLLSVLFSVYPEVGLLDQPRLTFPPALHRVPTSLCPRQHLVFPWWFFGRGEVIVATLTAVIQRLVVVLTYVLFANAHSLLHWLYL